MTSQSHIPAGYRTITPYLIVAGASKLIDFLKIVFDAEEIMRFPQPDGTIMHASLRIGDSMVELSDASGEWQPVPGSIHIYVPDTDATYQRALKAGATSLRAPEDMFYGERAASVRDAVGNFWHIATFKEALTIQQINERAINARPGTEIA